MYAKSSPDTHDQRAVPNALSPAAPDQAIDSALPDVAVRGEPAAPVADALMKRGVPLWLCFGYDRYTLYPPTAALRASVVLDDAVQPAHDHQLLGNQAAWVNH